MAQPFVCKSGAIVVGHPAGGWDALALASRNPTMVTEVINFACGRAGHADDQPNSNCVPERLVTTAAAFGRTARIPTLWLYAANDSYFAPAMSQRRYEDFRSARWPLRVPPPAAVWCRRTSVHLIR
jgi:dienelactone hydrolase